MQGIQDLPSKDTIEFIPKHTVPVGQTPTYGWIVVDYCLQKTEPHCACLTVSSHHINYPWVISTPTADLTTTKLLFNSTIFTPQTLFLSLDIKNFYLNMPLDWL